MRLKAAAGWLALSAVAMSGTATAACDDSGVHGALDFWVGHWEVLVEDRVIGHNRIEKVSGGCAVVEFWRPASGGEGSSFFWVDPASREWRQVWVTSEPFSRGGTKEKAQVSAPEGAVRMQGEIPLPDGGSYLDRTTLMPGEGGSVRQLIEISTDGGASWRAVFDAEYRRAAGGG